MKLLLLTVLGLMSFSSFSAETYVGIDETGKTCELLIEQTEEGKNKITILNYNESIDAYNDGFKFWKKRDLSLTTHKDSGLIEGKSKSVQRYDFDWDDRKRTNRDKVAVTLDNGKPISYSINSDIKIVTYPMQHNGELLQAISVNMKRIFHIPINDYYKRSSTCKF
ncbi:hypothetical protein ACJVC5_14955 [Peredibacter sp. HCB2-198]|uniref:hypothetical protein n=1 Tax=Peredibacter sp. HCB2-198 TaxID=3383025 RepID=UPI0038B4AAB5